MVTMQVFATFLIAALCCLVDAQELTGLAHYTTFKSFNIALQECAEYLQISACYLNKSISDGFPPEEKVKKLIRCALINVDSYSDADGAVHSRVSQYFEPAPGDTCYERRTRECLESTVSALPACDHNGRAYETFRCYYRYYGNLVDSLKFVAYAPLESDQIALFTMSIANLAQEDLQRFSQGDVIDEPNFPAVHFYQSVRGGFYSVANGTYLDNLYVQFNSPELLTPESQRCVESVKQQLCNADQVTLLYQIFKQCRQVLHQRIIDLYQRNAQALLANSKCS